MMAAAGALLVPVGAAAAPHAPPPPPTPGRELPWLVPPVDGAVGRPFAAPATQWGSGHRGVDFEAPAGTSVRAAASGTVLFAGRVASSQAVTVQHGGGLQTTYSVLSEVLVSRGDSVAQGHWIGRVGGSHSDTGGGLHFGVKLAGAYVDPQDFLGALDFSEAIHLAPLEGSGPLAGVAASIGRVAKSEHRPVCERRPRLEDAGVPPNDNLVVVVGGLSTSTADGARGGIFEVPQALGYSPAATYVFSYRGVGGSRGHAPYEDIDTYGDVDEKAESLGRLLEIIAVEHPGADVDIVAHSLGGLVARSFLERVGRAWDPDLPRIEHLVTFASPHGGVPLAGVPDDLREESPTGGALVAGASVVNEALDLSLPPPDSEVVAQLQPGSALLTRLASQDVIYGTQVLALGAPLDLLVPADRSLYEGKRNHVVAPTKRWREADGLLELGRESLRALGSAPGAHSALTASNEARSVAYHFLRDGAPECRGEWAEGSLRAARVIGGAESSIGRLVAWGERLLGRGVVLPGRP
jgi:hypothetical protein